MTKDLEKLIKDMEISIGNRVVHVEVVDEILDGALLGQSKIDNDKILISRNQSDTCAKEVLLHEVLHFIYSHQGMEMGIECNETEEYIVSVFAHNIFGVIAQNERMKNVLWPN